MNRIETILSKVRDETDTIILFSSVVGKDSILLTHYCCQMFTKVVSVYMYIVPGLSYIEKHKNYFKGRYSNIIYYDIPHYALTTYIRTGYMGIKKDSKQRKYNLATLTEMVREKTGVQWVVLGMKQNDSLNRRLQLRQYEDQAICRESFKAYPLSEFSNKIVLGLIDHLSLPTPIHYNNDRSQGEDISDPEYIKWLYENYPEDLKLVFQYFPMTKNFIYHGEE